MASKFSNKQLFDTSLLKQFGKDYVKILTIMLKRAGKSASGALINSLDFRLKREAKEILIILESNDYLEWVDKGRKPGSWPPVDAIRKWVSLKGIPQTAVYPIGKKIFDFGIEPTNVIDKTIKEIQTSNNFRKRYEDEMIENVEEIIFNQFKNIDK